jgi:hypothetical protein
MVTPFLAHSKCSVNMHSLPLLSTFESYSGGELLCPRQHWVWLPASRLACLLQEGCPPWGLRSPGTLLGEAGPWKKWEKQRLLGGDLCMWGGACPIASQAWEGWSRLVSFSLSPSGFPWPSSIFESEYSCILTTTLCILNLIPLLEGSELWDYGNFRLFSLWLHFPHITSLKWISGQYLQTWAHATHLKCFLQCRPIARTKEKAWESPHLPNLSPLMSPPTIPRHSAIPGRGRSLCTLSWVVLLQC